MQSLYKKEEGNNTFRRQKTKSNFTSFFDVQYIKCEAYSRSR